MTFYNSAISNRLMEWRTRTPEVQNTLNIRQIWLGIRCWFNLYMVTFEKTGSPLTIMLSSHIFSPNPRNNPPWESMFASGRLLRPDANKRWFWICPCSAPFTLLHLSHSLADCRTKRMLAMRAQTAMEIRCDVTMGLVMLKYSAKERSKKMHQ